MDSPEAIRVKEKYKASFVMLCPDWPKKLQISSPLLASFQFTQLEVPSSLTFVKPMLLHENSSAMCNLGTNFLVA